MAGGLFNSCIIGCGSQVRPECRASESHSAQYENNAHQANEIRKAVQVDMGEPHNRFVILKGSIKIDLQKLAV